MYQFPLLLGLVLAAGTAGRTGYAPPTGETHVLEEIEVYPNEAVTAHGTDYVTISVYVGSTQVMTARVTSSTGFTQGTVEQFTLTGTESQRAVTTSAPLSIRVTHAASGKAVNFGFTARFTRKNALTAA